IYVRGEVLHVIRRLHRAVAEAREAGYLGRDILGSGFDLEVVVHAGAGAYICGEETSLLDSLEGYRGQPRLKPPFPATSGLYACPTVVNNVESIASVPWILLHGAEEFASLGTQKSTGFGLFQLSGHVATPGQYEAPLGTTLREILDLSGGMRAGHRLKFWTPGGSSTPLLTDEHLDVPLDYEDVAAAGSMLGTRSLQVFDETTCVVRVVLRWIEFYRHESCGKCTPCREGSYWVVQLLEQLESGGGSEADLDKLLDICTNITGRAFCALGLDRGPGEIVDHVLPGRVPRAPAGRRLPVRPRGFDPVHPGVGPMTVQASQQPGGGVARPADGVTVTIDGFEITVPKGTLVIRAAEQLGIEIPRFCDHPLLDPIGACRQCLVHIEGQPKPPASCTTACTDGMVVHTQLTSEVAEKAQRGMMEFLLLNHPLDCPMCDKGGECPLQNQAMTAGQGETRFHGPKRTFPKPIALSAQVLLDRERCIQCARCTRFADQIPGDQLIDLFERGPQEQVGTAHDAPFDSYFSGNTVQICPVGALTSTSYRFRARPFDLVSTPSVCEHCASGCRQRTDHRRGAVTRRLAGNDPQVNEEWNCDKGRSAFTYATQPDRLVAPLVRDAGGVLRPASWPAAIAAAAAGLLAERGRAGVLTGGRLTLEDSYAYAKFARLALASNDIDMRARPLSAEETQFLAGSIAGQPSGVTYAGLERAGAVLLAGFEPQDESPIVFLRLRKAARSRGLAVYSVAALAGPGLSRMSGTLLPTRPGEEAEALDRLASATELGLDEVSRAAAQALREPGAVILAGERLAEVPGALTAAARLAQATGARLAWIPRRAGE